MPKIKPARAGWSSPPPARYPPVVPDAPTPPVHALLDDLFFRAKVEATASAAGVPVVFARTPGELAGQLDAHPGTATVLVDLQGAGCDAGVVVEALKSRPDPPYVVAFGSHQNREGLAASREAGADETLPRSDFVRRLPRLLQEM